MPFDQFFTVAVESLSEAFKRGHDDLGFCGTFRTMLMKSGHSKCKGEFNAKQSLMGEGAGHSPPNVFPLPAFPPEFLGQMLGGSALGALRSLNWLHGGSLRAYDKSRHSRSQAHLHTGGECASGSGDDG